MKYLGGGRFQVSAEKSCRAGESYSFLPGGTCIFSAAYRKNGTININGPNIESREVSQLKSLGAEISGTFTVSLEPGVTVISHNAQSVPMFFGLLGAYTLKIGEPGINPYIVIKPSY